MRGANRSSRDPPRDKDLGKSPETIPIRTTLGPWAKMIHAHRTKHQGSLAAKSWGRHQLENHSIAISPPTSLGRGDGKRPAVRRHGRRYSGQIRWGSLRWPPGLLRPLLTSRSSSPPSPFQAQGEISRGKNVLLRCIAAEFMPSRLALIAKAARLLARSPCLAAPSIGNPPERVSSRDALFVT